LHHISSSCVQSTLLVFNHILFLLILLVNVHSKIYNLNRILVQSRAPKKAKIKF